MVRASRHTCREGHWFESSIAHRKKHEERGTSFVIEQAADGGAYRGTTSDRTDLPYLRHE
jgi:hypothetical protein